MPRVAGCQTRQFLALDLGNPERKTAEVVRHGHHSMGTVSISTQWLIVAAGVVLCPVFGLLTACLIGWLVVLRLWTRPEIAPGSLAREPLKFREGDATLRHLMAGVAGAGRSARTNLT